MESEHHLPQQLNALEDLDDGVGFDQFKGKKSTYKDEIYTTVIDQTKISHEVRKYAEKMEKEISKMETGGNIHLAEERN